jgi:glucokinase
MGRFVCGVDLGGTKISTGIVDESGKVIQSLKIPTNVEEGSDAVISRINMSIDKVLEMSNLKLHNLSGIGIGAPGPLDIEKGIVVYSANLPGWRDVPIANKIKEKYELPIRLNNDGNAAVLGEYLFGTGRGSKNFIYITISTGIGAGAVIDGKLFNGANSNALEVGHMTINTSGPKCGCGNHGCFEALASGTSIARRAQKMIDEGRETIILVQEKNAPVKAEYVFDAARNGDKVALEIIDTEAFYLGVGISNIINLFNPDKIALGGGVSTQMDMFYSKMMQTVTERTLRPNAAICEVVRAKLGNEIGIIGAASLILCDD